MKKNNTIIIVTFLISFILVGCISKHRVDSSTINRLQRIIDETDSSDVIIDGNNDGSSGIVE